MIMQQKGVIVKESMGRSVQTLENNYLGEQWRSFLNLNACIGIKPSKKNELFLCFQGKRIDLDCFIWKCYQAHPAMGYTYLLLP